MGNSAKCLMTKEFEEQMDHKVGPPGYPQWLSLDHNFSICIQCSDTPSKQFCNLFVLLPFVSNFSTDWKRATQGVWKSHKKSHSMLRAKRGYIYILIGQKFIKNANNGLFWRVLENLKLAVKQCYQTGHF